MCNLLGVNHIDFWKSIKKQVITQKPKIIFLTSIDTENSEYMVKRSNEVCGVKGTEIDLN